MNFSPEMCNSPEERNKKKKRYFDSPGLIGKVVMVKYGKVIGFVNACKRRV